MNELGFSDAPYLPKLSCRPATDRSARRREERREEGRPVEWIAYGVTTDRTNERAIDLILKL